MSKTWLGACLHGERLLQLSLYITWCSSAACETAEEENVRGGMSPAHNHESSMLSDALKPTLHPVGPAAVRSLSQPPARLTRVKGAMLGSFSSQVRAAAADGIRLYRALCDSTIPIQPPARSTTSIALRPSTRPSAVLGAGRTNRLS